MQVTKEVGNFVIAGLKFWHCLIFINWIAAASFLNCFLAKRTIKKDTAESQAKVNIIH